MTLLPTDLVPIRIDVSSSSSSLSSNSTSQQQQQQQQPSESLSWRIVDTLLVDPFLPASLVAKQLAYSIVADAAVIASSTTMAAGQVPSSTATTVTTGGQTTTSTIDSTTSMAAQQQQQQRTPIPFSPIDESYIVDQIQQQIIEQTMAFRNNVVVSTTRGGGGTRTKNAATTTTTTTTLIPIRIRMSLSGGIYIHDDFMWDASLVDNDGNNTLLLWQMAESIVTDLQLPQDAIPELVLEITEQILQYHQQQQQTTNDATTKSDDMGYDPDDGGPPMSYPRDNNLTGAWPIVPSTVINTNLAYLAHHYR